MASSSSCGSSPSHAPRDRGRAHHALRELATHAGERRRRERVARALGRLGGGVGGEHPGAVFERVRGAGEAVSRVHEAAADPMALRVRSADDASRCCCFPAVEHADNPEACPWGAGFIHPTI